MDPFTLPELPEKFLPRLRVSRERFASRANAEGVASQSYMRCGSCSSGFGIYGLPGNAIFRRYFLLKLSIR